MANTYYETNQLNTTYGGHQVFGASIIQRHARTWMTLTLGISDLICLLVSFWLALWIRSLLGAELTLSLYYRLLAFIPLFLIFYTFRGLYQPIGLGVVEEFRRLTISTSLLFVVLTAASFWLHGEYVYSRLTFLVMWGAGIMFVPFGRKVARSWMIRFNLWGEPVAVIGPHSETAHIVNYLNQHPRVGRKPVVIYDNQQETLQVGNSIQKCLLIDAAKYCRKNRIRSALFVYQDLNELGKIRDSYRDIFERVLLVSRDENAYQLSGVSVEEFGDVVSLEIHQPLLNHRSQFEKRLIDIVGSSFALIVLSPLLLILALFIKLSSKGSILYNQQRIGRNGRVFTMLKFRSMYTNADQILKTVLEKDPALRREWNCYQKLHHDPRVTPIGRFMRRFSLDELPQFWNVLIGEMSLVGPRPMMVNQRELYGPRFENYVRVVPGITGMWQVNGRNRTSFKQRAEMDERYVMNWSLWLDIYILIRTVWVLITSDGAC
jgi:Undecaprenyl-phosphate galactose phosphotransferase WbaP